MIRRAENLEKAKDIDLCQPMKTAQPEMGRYFLQMH